MRLTIGAMILLSPLALAAQGATRCGVDRWPVKILYDRDASSVDLVPKPTTVAALRDVPEPNGERPHSGRLAIERHTFRVRALLRARIDEENDGDIHLVIVDPADSSLTMVAEIPDSTCALGAPHASDFAEARRVLAKVPNGAEVELEGVAFFDSAHGQHGMAPNGIELHPVLRVALVLAAKDLEGGPSGDLAVPDTASDSSGRVWVNTASMVYHCPGSRYYGGTKRGEYMPETAARRAGARPAGGRACR